MQVGKHSCGPGQVGGEVVPAQVEDGPNGGGCLQDSQMLRACPVQLFLRLRCGQLPQDKKGL